MLVGIGDNCVDSYLEPIKQMFAGGNALNVAANARLHGYPAAYIGSVGDDAHGRYILHALRELGIDTGYITVRAGDTGLTKVRITAGEPFILEEVYGVSNQVDLNAHTMEFVRREADIVHLSIHSEVEKLTEELSVERFPLSCDFSNQNPLELSANWFSLLRHLDYVFFSGAGLELDVLRNVIKGIVHCGPRHVIVTRGSQGSMAYWEGGELSYPSLLGADELVDTFGAGDAFIAGFLISVIHGGTAEQHLRQASLWAAEACRHYGAWVISTSDGQSS